MLLPLALLLVLPLRVLPPWPLGVVGAARGELSCVLVPETPAFGSRDMPWSAEEVLAVAEASGWPW